MRRSACALVLLLAAHRALAGPQPDPERIGVFAETSAGLIELRPYGKQTTTASSSDEMSVVFRFPGAVPSASRCNSFLVHVPEGNMADAALFWLTDLGAKFNLEVKRKSDQTALVTRVEQVGDGDVYRVTSPGLMGKARGYAALLLPMPVGSANRLYAVRLGADH